MQAVEELSGHSSYLQPSLESTTFIEQTLQEYATTLDIRLRNTREKKWRRDGIRPRPLETIAIRKQESYRRRGRRSGKKVQRRRFERNGPSQREDCSTTMEQTVVNLSSHVLTTSEMSLLRKGLTFCPTDANLNHTELTADLHQFYRRLRLKDYFAERQACGSPDNESALSHTALRQRSLWQPPPGTVSPEVEAFIRVFHNHVSEALRHSRKEVKNNLSETERLALQALQRRKDIVIRPADKGSAIVIQDDQHYNEEALRQLSDKKFYKKLDGDPTLRYNKAVSAAVRVI